MLSAYRVVPLCLAALAWAALATPSFAQDSGVKIGIVNTAKIFADMQETKDLAQKMNAQRDQYLKENEEKKTEIKAIEQQRDTFKPDSAQFLAAEEKYVEASIRYEIWQKSTQARVQRERKQQTKTLFDKIEAAVAEVAQQKGLDLVLTKHKTDLPDNLETITYEQLTAQINQRDVLYVVPKLDISDDVLAVLDRNYRARGEGKK